MSEAKQLLLEALETRWKKFRSELKHCRIEFTEEAVHDLRVATRRLLALFDLFRSITPHKRLQKIRRELKDQLNDLDDLRDTQVLLADLSEVMQDHPELKPFQEHLLKEEKHFMRLTRKLVSTREHKRLNQRIEKTQNSVNELPEDALTLQIIAAADDAFARVMQAYHAIDAQNVASIHKLRIAFKRFRYTVEVIHPLLTNFPSANFERMHNYQSQMGDIQDMEVASQRAADVETASDSLEAVTTHYASRLQTAVRKFLEDKGEVLIFWRTSPDQPFPWEK